VTSAASGDVRFVPVATHPAAALTCSASTSMGGSSKRGASPQIKQDSTTYSGTTPDGHQRPYQGNRRYLS